MKAAIYGRTLNEAGSRVVQTLVAAFKRLKIGYTVFLKFREMAGSQLFAGDTETFSTYQDLAGKVDYLFSIGGDGTLLDTVTLVRDSGIPVIGINTGRLGFLASIGTDEVSAAVDALQNGTFVTDSRTLIHLESNTNLFHDQSYALNEFTIHKKDTSSMITIHTYLNGEHLNSYWCDGLIVATPTGSTGYSLSCGGPIIHPSSSNFVITPVAPHNLNVRPIIVPDDNVISFEIEGRNINFLCTMDSRYKTIDSSFQLAVRKENFAIRLARLNDKNFLNTLRTKLMWGHDSRN